ncbi:N-formylglutamate amidohydrolase [Salipiger aestuarii]|uniref:Putative N-formylglutamate amidohydrolase n=1 Tax=Salipiger aestuarii TaxID=568098 RepID=A0A327YSQ6_9RHOB|nr:N-formylglutamate amidohydrolase [Salipiger aestuarii]EIE51148.1 N-formylglutamate amidohydrolase family protein [Citreicella sp. 357]KAA8610175.1 N-formylglutamate amidohydrolase [Salipiger aestuarii]KAA8616015.1 N-formylglutamate amidohydrolase [Salipiger aestuarii]KAB2543374.1 N-formylglutamate amidohydrolase [Salipiger aestuarii]RAK23953.1 putative N-formylglutamate amidohydrolase [Salipiger aestuarii]
MTYAPYTIEGENRDSGFLVTCDHATNTVPPDLGGSLGLPQADMARHIAYDLGALGTARALAAALGAPLVASNFSRLVIDPNRGEDDPTLLMRLYDGSIIPGNRHADDAERARRLDRFWHPYHGAIERMAARRKDVAIVAVHSFTPQLRGRPLRPWHVGILHAWDARLSDPLIALLERVPDLTVGRNQPYPGHLPGDAIHRHALRYGRNNTLIELRHDLIADTQAQNIWGQRLAPLLEAALAQVAP